MKNGISLVIPSELDAYQDAIAINGLSEADFKLAQLPGPRTVTKPIILGIVQVTYNPTKASRSYQVCMGSSWPTEFLNDLESGVFS
ncbi:hypothetical protein [Motiliproteus sp. MSK22-1]|uniref:hypothetical protein n=1 Tax=Motiliproteus sp. MSK22-1 TaxID=1897630 RepID=UPI0009759FD6|nr:hypothetical protein [Motiliproteus sp. MSK22-1]OMH39422.1 hypothetical protein BGP75_03690 [Motiliproteus sp. MSK22-1]